MRSQASYAGEFCLAPETTLGLLRLPQRIVLVRSQHSVGLSCTEIPCLAVHPRLSTLSSTKKQWEPLVPEIYRLFRHEHRQGATCSKSRPVYCRVPRPEYRIIPA